MIRILFGVFIVLHGLVHLLYFGQSARYFELQPGMTWPAGSWVFSGLFGEQVSRALASLACVLAAAGFIAGGIGVLVRQAWQQPLIVGSAVFSAAIFVLFWDGKMQELDDKGLIAMLINLALLVVLLVKRGEIW